MDWLTDTKSVRPSLAYQQQKWPTNQTVHISVFQIQHMIMDSRRTNWLLTAITQQTLYVNPEEF